MERRKTVGVIGGMGPETTIDFMQRVLTHTKVEVDQDHLHLIVDQDPTIPPRQEALLGDGEDPGPAIAAMARRLESAGADFLVIPCNTAHAWQQVVLDAVNIPLLSIVDATIAACDGRSPIALLATDGCLRAGIYNTDEALLPDEADQARIMEIVRAVKSRGASDELRRDMRSIAMRLVEHGAQIVVAACTEIPLLLRDGDLPVPVIESTEELALATIRMAQDA